ncbi:MAG: fumarate hydratase [Deltaproteobacteria bacterium]|nr:fumarate hydratase [Deltaproteobacteria bacterium]
MRTITASDITPLVKEMCMSANFDLGDDVLDAFRNGLEREESHAGKAVLEQLLENSRIAREERSPMCQDTGFAVFFLELGRDLHIDGDIYSAINEGVRQGYEEGFLRKSIVSHPINRVNTKDNTPAIIHIEIVPGDKLKVTFAPKGGGSENMSSLKMLKPSDGIEGVKDFVVDAVKKAGPNPCPPIIVGVGLGGTFEKAPYLAKKALLRHVGERSSVPEDAKLEEDLEGLIGDLGIGPMGFGGRVTALSVQVESHPCHIASLPVAVNIQCHAARHKEVVI